MHRTDYDFDVISGPSTPVPAPAAAVIPPAAASPRRPGDTAAPAPPRRPVEDAPGRGNGA